MTAVDAVRGMHALQAAAFRTYPALPFRRNERIDAFIADNPQIVKHAHPVLHAIPGVEPLKPGARKPLAVAAISSCTSSAGSSFFLGLTLSGTGFRLSSA